MTATLTLDSISVDLVALLQAAKQESKAEGWSLFTFNSHQVRFITFEDRSTGKYGKAGSTILTESCVESRIHCPIHVFNDAGSTTLILEKVITLATEKKLNMAWAFHFKDTVKTNFNAWNLAVAVQETHTKSIRELKKLWVAFWELEAPTGCCLTYRAFKIKLTEIDWTYTLRIKKKRLN